MAQVENFEKQIEDMEKSSQTLKNEIANADNIDYLEKIAYEQLGQQKPGEKEIIFIMPEEKIQTLEEKQGFWNNFSSWLSSVREWIKNIF